VATPSASWTGSARWSGQTGPSSVRTGVSTGGGSQAPSGFPATRRPVLTHSKYCESTLPKKASNSNSSAHSTGSPMWPSPGTSTRTRRGQSPASAISRSGCSTALVELAGEMGLHPSEMMAIGDSENDIEMLKAAGIGVAVQNAAAPVQAVADWVSPSTYGDGFVEAVKKYYPYLFSR